MLKVKTTNWLSGKSRNKSSSKTIHYLKYQEKNRKQKNSLHTATDVAIINGKFLGDMIMKTLYRSKEKDKRYY